jgi:hypothetical protein
MIREDAVLLRPRHYRPRSRRPAEQRDELAPFHVGHGGLLPKKAMALRGRFAAHLAYHGGDARSLGRTELF